MYLSTAQETGGSLNWSLTDEGKLRANLLLMFAFSYEIKVFLWMLFQVLETAVEIGIKLLSDFHSSQTVPPSSSRPCSLVLSWVQSELPNGQHPLCHGRQSWADGCLCSACSPQPLQPGELMAVLTRCFPSPFLAELTASTIPSLTCSLHLCAPAFPLAEGAKLSHSSLSHSSLCSSLDPCPDPAFTCTIP